MQGDFELEWELENHRLAVTKQLRKRFNAFHHELHKIYTSFPNNDEALAAGCSLVTPMVWVKLCMRWSSEHFKVYALLFSSIKTGNVFEQNAKYPSFWCFITLIVFHNVYLPCQKISEQNRENRKKQKINHTSGRKSFVRKLAEKV